MQFCILSTDLEVVDDTELPFYLRGYQPLTRRGASQTRGATGAGRIGTAVGRGRGGRGRLNSNPVREVVAALNDEGENGQNEGIHINNCIQYSSLRKSLQI